ncbi:hypothetical protein SAMN06272789_6654 [Streptomyces sp. 1331.2]|nr:hypothetical protein SAMN06272789_6654 [Streptomyces sp. 1331.2]
MTATGPHTGPPEDPPAAMPAGAPMMLRHPHPHPGAGLATVWPVLAPAILAAGAGLLPWSVLAALTVAQVLLACLRTHRPGP